MDVSGLWSGELALGPEYGEHSGKLLWFDLELHQNGHSITGIARDTHGFGLNADPADITGQVNGDQMTFLKRYRSTQLTDRTNLKWGPGPAIHYSGTLDAISGRFDGVWRMESKKILFGLISINPPSTGTWNMNRKV